MKDKKKILTIVFVVVCIVILSICLVINLFIKKEDKNLEKESKKLSTLTVKTKSGTEIETNYTHVDDYKFYIKIPTSFRQLSYEETLKKYSGNVPGVVFSNEDMTINVAISITEDDMKNSAIKEYINYMENLLKSNSEIIKTDYYEVDKHNVGLIKLVTKAQDTNIYNNMICFSNNDKLVIVTFNCTEELKEEWQEVGDFIIESLFFKE